MKKDFNDVNDVWDELIDNELFTHDELQLITNMISYSVETLNDALFARYGYRDLEQMLEE